MEHDPAAVPVLGALELKRFVRSDITEYGPLYDMIEAIGPVWFAMDVGPAPRRPGAGDKETGRQGDKVSGAATGTMTKGGP